jgi:sugar/nucleoside kinase (ribokinase family)
VSTDYADRVGDPGRYRGIDADSRAGEHGRATCTGLLSVDDLDRDSQRIGEELTPQRTTGSASTEPGGRLDGKAAPECIDLRPRVEALVEAADLVKVSAEDLAWLLPRQPPVQVARAWRTRGPAIVVVTLGPGGVVAASADGMVHRPGRPVAVVDTVGAGDAFTSGLLAGLHRRHLLGAHRRADLATVDRGTLAEVLDEAVLVAALTCTRRGADPPSAAELRGRIPSGLREEGPRGKHRS